ncbi:hypothetical protein B7P43_G01917 [Cryptotermes secundus]|uniref:Uncharacterized protein n=1 Tax=Cryptotermes secundus TaxID=105785 RepID=A0A2J7QLS8_9NEOP|nr:hypothetical protein B7P43_G01917 [Cryptotermes secundus]
MAVIIKTVVFSVVIPCSSVCRYCTGILEEHDVSTHTAAVSQRENYSPNNHRLLKK